MYSAEDVVEQFGAHQVAARWPRHRLRTDGPYRLGDSGVWRVSRSLGQRSPTHEVPNDLEQERPNGEGEDHTEGSILLGLAEPEGFSLHRSRIPACVTSGEHVPVL